MGAGGNEVSREKVNAFGERRKNLINKVRILGRAEKRHRGKKSRALKG